MRYTTFINDQLDLKNIAKAYKNNQQFRGAIDQNPKLIFQNELKGHEGEIEIAWCDDANYYIVFPCDPNITIEDETYHYIAAAKWVSTGIDSNNIYYDNLENNESYRYDKAQPVGANGIGTFIKVDPDGADIPGSEFRAIAPGGKY